MADERESSNIPELLQAQARVYHDTLAYTGAMSLKCAVELGIPDTIYNHGGAMTALELASAMGLPLAKTPSLRRLMRLLSNLGYFTTEKQPNKEEEEEEIYSLTSASKILIKSKPTNMATWVECALHPNFTNSFQCLSSWFKSSDVQANPHELAHGMSIWDLASRNPEFNDMFNEAMAAQARVMIKAILEERRVFEGLTSIVDVGGGDGTCMQAIAEVYPNMRCVVYDLPHVVAGVPNSYLVDAVAGDMFDQVPRADAVFMKHIMHCWSDEECVKILKKCKEAIPVERGKVIVVDIVRGKLAEESELTQTKLFWDILTMACVTGKERDECEWKKLFEFAGFTSYKETPLGNVSIIEVFP